MKNLFKKRNQLRKLPANKLFLPSRMPTVKNHQNHTNIIEKKASDQAKKRVKIFFPIQEEDQSSSSVEKEAYTNICKQCHSDLKEIKIGVNSGRGLIALSKLYKLIEDIESLKIGNFIVAEN